MSVNHKSFFLRRTLADPSFPKFTSISPTQKRHKSTRLMIHRKTEEEENSFGAFLTWSTKGKQNTDLPDAKKNEIILRRQRMNGFRLSPLPFPLHCSFFLLAAIQSSLGKGEMAGEEEEEEDPKASFFWLPLFSQTCRLEESDAAKNQNSASSEPEATGGGDSIRPFLRAKIASHGVWFSIPLRILRARV